MNKDKLYADDAVIKTTAGSASKVKNDLMLNFTFLSQSETQMYLELSKAHYEIIKKKFVFIFEHCSHELDLTKCVFVFHPI